MFNNINKEADFEKDILISKTLQLLINLLSLLHTTKLQPIMSLFEKKKHLEEIINGCLTIVDSFMKSVVKQQNAKFEELRAKNCHMDHIFNVLAN
jgi:hypothetical protein